MVLGYRLTGSRSIPRELKAESLLQLLRKKATPDVKIVVGECNRPPPQPTSSDDPQPGSVVGWELRRLCAKERLRRKLENDDECLQQLPRGN